MWLDSLQEVIDLGIRVVAVSDTRPAAQLAILNAGL